MKEFYIEYQKQIYKYGALAIFIFFIFIFVKYLFAYVVPFVLGFLISLLLVPIADFLQVILRRISGGKIYLSRGVASITSILLLLLGISFLGTNIVTRAISQGRQLMLHLPEYWEQAHLRIIDINEQYNALFELIPFELREFAVTMIDSFRESLTTIIGSGIRTGTLNTVVILPQILITTLLTLISAFFFIKDKELIKQALGKRMPKFMVKNFQSVSKGINGALLGYVKAQLLLMSITGLIAVIGLMLIDYPYALFIGLLIACVDALPILGSGFVLWPWAVYSLILGNYTRAISLITIYAVITVARQSLEPKVLGHQIGVHPLLTLMSIYIGLHIFGVLGFLIGPVILVSSKAILESV